LRAARETAGYRRLRQVLLPYVSPILLDSVLNRAMSARGLSPDSVTPEQLGEVASEMMLGLRMFVPEEQLSGLMLQLAELLEGLL
jgi:hypothetical protein